MTETHLPREKIQLNIGSFNIQGSLQKKTTYNDFKDFINNTDITVIQESWLQKGDKLKFKDYLFFKANRKKSKKAKRGSGGVLIFYKEQYAKGICRKKSSDEKHVIWIKCRKQFFGLHEDLYIAGCYFPPQKSGRKSEDIEDVSVFGKLEKDINRYSSLGKLLILGDFNARISNKVETLYENNIFDQGQGTPPKEDKIRIPSRISQDIKTNPYGNKLIQLCSNSNLLILNGRKLGDTHGSYTSHQPNGSSVVDLSMCSHDLYADISHFKVLEPTWLSDHCPTQSFINTDSFKDYYCQNDSSPVCDMPTKFKWTSQAGSKLARAAAQCKCLFEELVPGKDPTKEARALENILLTLAERNLTKITSTPVVETNNHKWMTDEIFRVKKTLKRHKICFSMI